MKRINESNVSSFKQEDGKKWKGEGPGGMGENFAFTSRRDQRIRVRFPVTSIRIVLSFPEEGEERVSGDFLLTALQALASACSKKTGVTTTHVRIKQLSQILPPNCRMDYCKPHHLQTGASGWRKHMNCQGWDVHQESGPTGRVESDPHSSLSLCLVKSSFFLILCFLTLISPDAKVCEPQDFH